MKHSGKRIKDSNYESEPEDEPKKITCGFMKVVI
jgi:hypothetical protein